MFPGLRHSALVYSHFGETGQQTVGERHHRQIMPVVAMDNSLPPQYNCYIIYCAFKAACCG